MVQLSNICFRYKKKKPLFENLSLSLQPGYIYGLLGKNGAGKSSLLKHIAGLVFPDSGSCTVMGYEASARKPEMLQDIYMIPEEFELPAVSLDTFVKMNAVFYAGFSQTQLSAYLAEFELGEHEKLSTLSYGQKKKFLIAFGLATNAKVLILDEPTNGLDIPSKSQFRKIMAAALDEERIIIISTHQVRDLENLIDNIVVLEQGTVIFNRSLSSISEHLAFEHNLNGVPTEEVLYAEEMQGRKAGIVRNMAGIESRVDLELLFNGIVKSPTAINEAFKGVEYKY